MPTRSRLLALIPILALRACGHFRRGRSGTCIRGTGHGARQATRLGAEAAPERGRRPRARRGQSVRCQPLDRTARRRVADPAGHADQRRRRPRPRGFPAAAAGRNHAAAGRAPPGAPERVRDPSLGTEADREEHLVRQRGLRRRRARRQPAEHHDVRLDVRLSLPRAPAFGDHARPSACRSQTSKRTQWCAAGSCARARAASRRCR